MNWIQANEKLPNGPHDVLCVTKLVNGKRKQFVGNYTRGHEIEFYDDDYDGEYDAFEEKAGALYLKPGWYELEETPGGNYDQVWVFREVTHWAILPEPPVTSSPKE